MCLQSSRLQLFKAVQEQFGKAYPFLKIEFRHPPDQGWLKPEDDQEHQQREARNLLREDIRLADELTVEALEHAAKEWFGMPVHILRKSGKVWMDTSHTGGWSLKKQNELGGVIASELK